MASQVDDLELVEAARNGDRFALDQLLRRHYDRIHAVTRRIAGGTRDADDACQEALIKIVKNLPTFDGRSSFGTWAYRIATNAALDELRKRRRRPMLHAVDDVGDETPPEQRRPDPLAHREVDAVADRLALDEAFDEIDDDFRAAVVLRDVGDLDYAEIAEVLDVPVGTVYQDAGAAATDDKDGDVSAALTIDASAADTSTPDDTSNDAIAPDTDTSAPDATDASPALDTVIDALATGTVLMGVPTHYARLCNSPRLSADACSTMRLFTCGSAPLTEPAFAEFAHRSGHTICERYGMSETGITISNPYDGERLAGTVGFPLPGVDAKVIDEDERELPRGEIGVLAIRSRQVMREYWRRPEATAAAHTNDGWFITGDVASMAPDGRVTLQGRAGDMIISGGENIYPKEIELVLDAIDGITESAVIGVPDDDFGERVLAVLVCDDTPLDETELRPHLDRSLARFKHPRRFEVVEALPRNAMGKVQKSVLRQRYAAGD